MGKFEITKRSNGQYQFNLKADNGEIILTSEGYLSKTSCASGIEAARKNALDDTRFERKTYLDGNPFFVLKARNGEIIGTSESYSSAQARDRGIEVVKKNAPEATVGELA